jgi:hypothetical protein
VSLNYRKQVKSLIENNFYDKRKIGIDKRSSDGKSFGDSSDREFRTLADISVRIRRR